jgi:hypothetical protein
MVARCSVNKTPLSGGAKGYVRILVSEARLANSNMAVFSSCCPPDDRAEPIIDDNRATPLGNQLDFAALASPLSV